MTLFEDGDWRLQTDIIRPSAIYHRCQDGPEYWWDTEKAYWWHVGWDEKVCCHCSLPVPEAIIGLHTLYNWDR